MLEENDKCNFLHKIIEETKSGKLLWERSRSADPEYGNGYIYNASIKKDVTLEIFRYCNNNFTMGEVLPSFRLYVGKHSSHYRSEQNDSCHKLLTNICILIDSIIQNDSNQIILDYLKL